LYGFNQIHAIVSLTDGAFDLRVPFMTNHDDFSAGRAHALDLNMHLGH
jgi:hypothetical protein